MRVIGIKVGTREQPKPERTPSVCILCLIDFPEKGMKVCTKCTNLCMSEAEEFRRGEIEYVRYPERTEDLAKPAQISIKKKGKGK